MQSQNNFEVPASILFQMDQNKWKDNRDKLKKIEQINRNMNIAKNQFDNNFSNENNVRSYQQESILTKLYFCDQNIKIIQKQLIMGVYKKTNGEFIIEPQDERDLLIVMKQIFLSNATHLPYNYKDQIRYLNNITVDEILPDLVSQVYMQNGYQKLISENRQIIDHPKYTTKKGSY